MIINDAVKKQAQSALADLSNPVRLIVFTQEMECQFCRENRQLAEEVAGLSDKISLEVYNFLLDKEKVVEFQVERVPALVVVGEKDYGIRFYGVPAGFEFSSLVAAIKTVGMRDSGLSARTKEQLAGLKTPVTIDVFVTLTCPYCPLMVSLAHRFAMASDLITASAIDAQEFPVLANYYDVMAVPRTLINRSQGFEGAVSEERLLDEVLKAAGTAGKGQVAGQI